MSEVMLETGPVHPGIDATNRRFEAAFDAGDPARAAREAYTRGARVLPPGAPLVQGRDNAAAFWQAAAQQLGIRKVRLSTRELEVNGERAHEIGQATLTLADDQAVTAKYVVVWKNEGGEWRWDVDIWNMDG